ncbi:MAG TPA: substrate-binding domain-containing protein [Lacunisphaera sp.]|jgi:ribose transport system substrate-binding protein|nr:substrate-binding domain-containing protein [Lacunisphaera sp.]
MRPLSLLLVGAALGARLVAAEPLQIAVIPKGTSHEYWKAVQAGAIKAERELNAAGTAVHVIWKGPLKEDDREQQIQVVENFVGRQVNAIVISPLDANALIAPLAIAVEGHIPVVTIDSGLNSPLPSCYVATDNREGGRVAARTLAGLVGPQGRVMMLRNAVGSSNTEEREEGFLEVMHREFPGIKLVSTDQHGGVTRENAYRTSQNLLNRFGREIDGVFACNQPTTAGMLLALRDAGLVPGKVKFVGFDTGVVELAALAAGEVSALMVQDPFGMGYLGVKNAVAILRGDKVPKVIDTGVKVVTRDNLADPAIHDLVHPPLEQYLQ